MRVFRLISNAVNVYFGDTPGAIPETGVLYFHAVT